MRETLVHFVGEERAAEIMPLYDGSKRPAEALQLPDDPQQRRLLTELLHTGSIERRQRGIETPETTQRIYARLTETGLLGIAANQQT